MSTIEKVPSVVRCVRVEEYTMSSPELARRVSPTKSVPVKKRGGDACYFAPEIVAIAAAMMADDKDPCAQSKAEILSYGAKVLNVTSVTPKVVEAEVPQSSESETIADDGTVSHDTVRRLNLGEGIPATEPFKQNFAVPVVSLLLAAEQLSKMMAPDQIIEGSKHLNLALREFGQFVNLSA